MHERGYLVLLLAIQLLMILVIQPYGNFPLNDDWAYARSANWLNTEHRIRLSNWIAMNLLPQTIAGGLVTAVFGFSFDVLRHLTQIVAVGASIAAYWFFRRVALAPGHALVATLVLLAMPCWPVLANSYMTDIYCLVFALAASASFVRLLEQYSTRLLAIATVLSVLGTLQRQVVVVIPFAFMVTWLWTRRERTARGVVAALAPFAAVLAAELLYQLYLKNGPGVPEAQLNAHARVWPLLLRELRGDTGMRAYVGSNMASMTAYLGWFMSGWIVWWGAPGTPRRSQMLAAMLALLAAGVALSCNWLPPYQPNNIIDAAGIGPFTLYGEMSHPDSVLDRSPGLVWRVAGVAAAFGFVAVCALTLATLAYHWRYRRDVDGCRVFLAILVIAYLTPFAITDYFDRYLLFVLPFLIALWARTWPIGEGGGRRRLPRVIALCWILLVTGLGTAATHDYFAWNRARWEAIRLAESSGATAETLDGGFEYNGFQGYETRGGGAAGKSWWWVRDDEYVAAFSLPSGYAVAATIPVSRWLSRTPDHVNLLHRRHE